MSQTSTDYRFVVNMGNDMFASGGTFTVNSASGMTDELALATVRALQGVPWPANNNTQISVTKTATDTTQSEGDPVNNTFVAV